MSNPIVVENTFACPRADVWKAITDREEMVQWYFDMIPAFEPTVGFETQFNVHCEGVVYLHLWKVTEVVPQSKLVYDWRYEGFPGESYVVWELEDAPEGGTKLTFRHEDIHTFPQDNPTFSRESTQAGWDYFIKGALPKYLSEEA